MAREDRIKAQSVRIDDRPIGDYVIDLDVDLYDPESNSGERFEFSLELDNALSLRQHLDNAIDSLFRRQMADLVCGDCEVCKNVRMVKGLGPGGTRDWIEHCPECKPKLDAMRQKVGL